LPTAEYRILETTMTNRSVTREDRLRNALIPLAKQGVTPEQAMELMLAASTALRDGDGIGWYHVGKICDAVYRTAPQASTPRPSTSTGPSRMTPVATTPVDQPTDGEKRQIAHRELSRRITARWKKSVYGGSLSDDAMDFLAGMAITAITED
jgi:hypothetical protein